MRFTTTVLCTLAFVGAAGAGRVAMGGDLAPGMLRAAQDREGAWIREEPKPLAKRVTRIPYGDQVKVMEVRELWARVSTLTEPASVGWTRANDLLEPGSLSGGSAAARALVASEVSAAGRQFDDPGAGSRFDDPGAGKQFDFKTEGTLRTMDKAMDAAYVLVDDVERMRPTDEEVEAFIREGRLGQTVSTEAGAGVGAPAKLRLLGAVGDTKGVTLIEVQFTPMPKPVSDADFVRSMGLGFTPEHEYWLGRGVAASAIARHGLDKDARRQRLVKKIGAAIVMLSENLRGTHGGWHFAVLDSDQPNGIAGPGGFVLLTRGAIALARNEDEVAAIIAHEMAHIHYQHGEQMVRKTREFQDEMKALEEKLIHAPSLGGDCNLCGDVARTLGTAAKTLADKLESEGYDERLELDADFVGSLYLCEVGYRAAAVAEYLEVLPKREGARWTTHPSSDARIEALQPLLFKHGCPFDADAGAQARLPRWKSSGLTSPK